MNSKSNMLYEYIHRYILMNINPMLYSNSHKQYNAI